MKGIQLREIRARFREELAGTYPSGEIDSIFHLLIGHFYGYSRMVLALEPRLELDLEAARPLLRALEDLKGHRPVQQITGYASFMGMELRVTPAVLIPRPETEELVRWALEDIPDGSGPSRVLDIGTGSGCIALGLKKFLPGAEVHAMDLSPEALEVARSNADLQGLRVHFHAGDVCDPQEEPWPQFDLLVSNPPYVPRRDLEQMEPHVAAFEPHLALFVPDGDPLKIYRCICRFAHRHLLPGGRVYLEIYEKGGPGVCGLLRQEGFSDIELKKDIFGRDRLIRARWTGTPS